MKMENGMIKELGMLLWIIWRSDYFLPCLNECLNNCLYKYFDIINFPEFCFPTFVTQRSEELGLFVVDEDDIETLLLHRIRSDDIYRKQEGQTFSFYQCITGIFFFLHNTYLLSVLIPILRYNNFLERSRAFDWGSP